MGYSFNPDRVAYYEKAGWEAYYAKNWLRVLGLMVRLNREEFHMDLPMAFFAALVVAAASAAYAPPNGRNNLRSAELGLRRYYSLARRSAGLSATAEELASLELNYWQVHRRLALERQQAPAHNTDLAPLVDSLERLHAALFAAPQPALHRSAEARAQAAAAVDRITGGYSQSVSEDWLQVETCLREAYRALLAESV